MPEVYEEGPLWVWSICQVFLCQFEGQRESDKGVEEGAIGADLGQPAGCAGPRGKAWRHDDGAELGLDVPGREG